MANQQDPQNPDAAAVAGILNAVDVPAEPQQEQHQQVVPQNVDGAEALEVIILNISFIFREWF